MAKPRVTLKCPANAHTGPDERIIEFSDGVGATGGLISFRRMRDGRLRVEVYRTDPEVEVVTPAGRSLVG
jgi:hypothetical protein